MTPTSLSWGPDAHLVLWRGGKRAVCLPLISVCQMSLAFEVIQFENSSRGNLLSREISQLDVVENLRLAKTVTIPSFSILSSEFLSLARDCQFACSLSVKPRLGFSRGGFHVPLCLSNPASAALLFARHSIFSVADLNHSCDSFFHLSVRCRGALPKAALF